LGVHLKKMGVHSPDTLKFSHSQRAPDQIRTLSGEAQQYNSPGRVPQRSSNAARITRALATPEGPDAPPHSWPCLLTSHQRSGLEILRGSNYPYANLPGRTHDTPAGCNPSGGYPFFTGDTGDKWGNRPATRASLEEFVPGSTGDNSKSAGDTGDK